MTHHVSVGRKTARDKRRGILSLRWERLMIGDWGSGIGDRGSGIGDRGSVIGDWGLGIGDWGFWILDSER